MTIRTLKNDETFSSKFDYNEKTGHVLCAFTVRPSEKELRHVLECDVDYSKLSKPELIELAHRGVVIDLQRNWRTLAATKGNTVRTVNPFAKVDVKSAVVDASRKVATPITRASSAISKMTAKERADMLAMLQAAVAADKKPASK